METRPRGPKGSPKRVEVLSTTANSGGIATFTFSPPYDTPPTVTPFPIWSGDQMYIGQATSITPTTCTVVVKRSRGTLLLSAGPFESAPNAPVQMLVVGD